MLINFLVQNNVQKLKVCTSLASIKSCHYNYSKVLRILEQNCRNFQQCPNQLGLPVDNLNSFFNVFYTCYKSLFSCKQESPVMSVQFLTSQQQKSCPVFLPSCALFGCTEVRVLARLICQLNSQKTAENYSPAASDISLLPASDSLNAFENDALLIHYSVLYFLFLRTAELTNLLLLLLLLHCATEDISQIFSEKMSHLWGVVYVVSFCQTTS